LEALKGQKQVRTNVVVSLTGSTSRMEFPSGTDIVLRGETDKELSEVRIRYRSAQKTGTGEAAATAPGETEILPTGGNHKTFEKRFDHIVRPIEFDFEFTDTDNVKSLRHIVIQPVEDRTPDVNVAVETIRKTPGGYMCTYEAMIPFSGSIRDDWGLSKVEYSINYAKVETPQATALRAGIAGGVFGVLSPSPNPFETLGATAIADLLGHLSESRESTVTPPPLPLNEFLVSAREKDARFGYLKAQLAQKLTQPPPDNAQVKVFEIKPEQEFLDLLERMPDMQKNKTDNIRPRYRMHVTISATDNNVETGPRVGQNKETFTFLVVSYEELLGEMNKEEEGLTNKMYDLLNKMLEVRGGIDKVIERLPKTTDVASDDYRASASRMVEMEEAVAKGRDVAQEILNDYNRLLKEVKTNRIKGKVAEEKETICNMLDEAIRQYFPNAEEAHRNLRQVFDERRAPDPGQIEASRQRQLELTMHLKTIYDKMGGIASLTKAAEQLSQLIKNEIIIKEMITRLLEALRDNVVQKLGKVELKSPDLELAKNERRSVTIDVNRDDLAEGGLNFRIVTPVDSGLEAPKTFFIDRTTNKIQFELVAGSKAGEFTVLVYPLTILGDPMKQKEPLVDKPFPLKVRVK
jgi:hypothetical protein